MAIEKLGKKWQHKFKLRASLWRGNRGCIASCLSSFVYNRQQQMARGWLPARPCQQECLVEVTLVGDGKARLFLSKSGQQYIPVLCFPRFQRHLFFDKVPETVSDMLVGTYGKEYTFYQLCFPYPLVAFAGCGNRQHSGHCCSEIAFTDQSTRTGCIQPGEPGALRCRIVHKDGQCTLSLVWTQRTKERCYCKVWQVLFADSLFLHLSCSLGLSIYSLPSCCSNLITDVLFYFLWLVYWWQKDTLSLSHLYIHTFLWYSHFLQAASANSFCPCIQSHRPTSLSNVSVKIKRVYEKSISIAFFWLFWYSIKYSHTLAHALW